MGMAHFTLRQAQRLTEWGSLIKD
jgi:hypothetical protein